VLFRSIDKTTHTLTQMRHWKAKYGHPFKPPFLKAELIDGMDLQQPHTATHFDLWVRMLGTASLLGRHDALYIPAKKHRGINRTLALPGAVLSNSAEIVRRNEKWYAHVWVTVPCPEVTQPRGWLGCDVGVRSAVVRSDGHKGPDLRPLFRRDMERQRNHAYHGIERKRSLSSAGQTIAKEAREAVLVAQRSGRGISLEAPKRLSRWKKHAARLFAERVLLLAAMVGLAVQEINPSGSSITCPKCGFVNRHMRHKQTFRCWRCGYTHNADFSAAQVICHRAYRITAVPPALPSRVGYPPTDG